MNTKIYGIEHSEVTCINEIPGYFQEGKKYKIFYTIGYGEFIIGENEELHFFRCFDLKCSENSEYIDLDENVLISDYMKTFFRGDLSKDKFCKIPYFYNYFENKVFNNEIKGYGRRKIYDINVYKRKYYCLRPSLLNLLKALCLKNDYNWGYVTDKYSVVYKGERYNLISFKAFKDDPIEVWFYRLFDTFDCISVGDILVMNDSLYKPVGFYKIESDFKFEQPKYKLQFEDGYLFFEAKLIDSKEKINIVKINEIDTIEKNAKRLIGTEIVVNKA